MSQIKKYLLRIGVVILLLLSVKYGVSALDKESNSQVLTGTVRASQGTQPQEEPMHWYCSAINTTDGQPLNVFFISIKEHYVLFGHQGKFIQGGTWKLNKKDNVSFYTTEVTLAAGTKTWYLYRIDEQILRLEIPNSDGPIKFNCQ